MPTKGLLKLYDLQPAHSWSSLIQTEDKVAANFLYVEAQCSAPLHFSSQIAVDFLKTWIGRWRSFHVKQGNPGA